MICRVRMGKESTGAGWCVESQPWMVMQCVLIESIVRLAPTGVGALPAAARAFVDDLSGLVRKKTHYTPTMNLCSASGPESLFNFCQKWERFDL